LTSALETTVDYSKTRVQFGVPIGTFQALKHRAAKMYIETELARSAVMAAHRAIGEGRDDATIARLASLTRARAADAFNLIAKEGVQMHGGIGMTDEHDIGFFLKRARRPRPRRSDPRPASTAGDHRDGGEAIPRRPCTVRRSSLPLPSGRRTFPRASWHHWG
jgi:hypothetical protein